MPDASGNFKGTGTLPEIPWHVPGASEYDDKLTEMLEKAAAETDDDPA